jgi:hypothetical protein
MVSAQTPALLNSCGASGYHSSVSRSVYPPVQSQARSSGRSWTSTRWVNTLSDSYCVFNQERASVTETQLTLTDEMRRAGLRRDAVRSQVIDALEAQEIKETGNEEG